MSWAQLAQMSHAAREQAKLDAALEELECPNDGTPLRERADGTLICPFDGYEARRRTRPQ